MKANLINHNDFFHEVGTGKIVLSNDRDANVFASWKVGGQDFYVYGIRQELGEESQSLSKRLKQAGIIANNVLYFNDNSDYVGALWDILRVASPDKFELEDCDIIDLEYIPECEDEEDEE